MGRHSSNKNNYALSGNAIVALVAILALLAGLIWFTVNKTDVNRNASGAEGDATCVLGDLALPVAASDKRIAQDLIGEYARTKPVVREYCVSPVLVDTLKDAAVYIAPATSVTHQELAQAGRSAAVAEPQSAHRERVGLAGKEKAGENVALDTVRFPTGSPAASAVVAFELADGPNAAVQALSDHRMGAVSEFEGGDGTFMAVQEGDVPGGLQFSPLNASVDYAAVPLNSSDSVDENQARAGQDFARFAADRFAADSEPAQPDVPEMVWAAAMPAGGSDITGGGAGRDAAVEAAADVRDTLFLLDTSDAMAPYLAAAQEAITEAANEVAVDGHSVALWNYSSPLNPGVTRGYRRNVALTGDPAEVANVVVRFGTGGEPRTREAVNAAVGTLAAGSGKSRLVLITTGTADAGMDGDDAFVRAIQDAGDNVDVSVVHVGDQARDQAMQSIAATNIQVDGVEKLGAAVLRASGL